MVFEKSEPITGVYVNDCMVFRLLKMTCDSVQYMTIYIYIYMTIIACRRTLRGDVCVLKLAVPRAQSWEAECAAAGDGFIGQAGGGEGRAAVCHAMALVCVCVCALSPEVRDVFECAGAGGMCVTGRFR